MSAHRDSISYAGLDFANLQAYDVTATRPYFGQPRLDIQQLATVNGAAVQGATFGHIETTREFVMTAPDATTRDVRLATIANALLDSLEGEQELVFGWNPDDTYMARVSSAFEPEVYVSGAKFSVKFIIPTGQPEE